MSGTVDWALFERIVTLAHASKPKRRALLRAAFKLNLLTKHGLALAEKRLARQWSASEAP